MREMVAKSNDPYINDTPWEIFYDDKGRKIGELYRHAEPAYDQIPRKRKRRRKKK